MEKGLTRKKVQTFGRPQIKLLNSPRDFFVLSLSISTGLLFFTIFLYIIIKLSSFDFSSSKQKDSFEGEGQSLDSLDDLLEETEESEETGTKKEEVEPDKETEGENKDDNKKA
jgi:hypothetical protein